MAFSLTRALSVTERQIKKFGGEGKLRRGSTDRDCICAILDFSPRQQGLIEAGFRRCLIAAKDLTIPPDKEQDLVVFGGEIWRIVLPIRGLRPGGTFIYYDMTVEYQEKEA